jgi:hypothetical protein
MADVAILVPVLARPQNVRPLLDSLRRSTPAGAWRAVFIADPDDLEEQREIRNHDAQLLVHAGSYAEKVNAAVRVTREPLVFTAADDISFHAGWLEAATRKLTEGIGVVGTNDLGNKRVIRGDHATHSLVTRAYCDLGTIDGQPGLLHEGYRHCFVDDELVATAKKRKAWAFAKDSIVEHHHPDWGKGEDDDTYQRGRLHFRRDRRTFHRRSRLWA